VTSSTDRWRDAQRVLILFLLFLAGCPKPVTEEFVHPAIEGGHAELTCAECHGDSLDTPPATCSGCHEEDRPADHDPGECGECHTITTWDALSGVDHDLFFPTPHEGVSDCVDCHLQAPNYDTFSCTDCHEHRRSEMDGEHLGEVGGYVYASNACLDCHPNGEEDD